MIDLRLPVNLAAAAKPAPGDRRFPTWMYHAAHGAKLFRDETAFKNAGDGWVDSPAKLAASDVASPAPGMPAEAEPTSASPAATAAPQAAEAADATSDRFTADELKSVHKTQAGELIDSLEEADAEMAQFIFDIESLNPVKPRPTVLQAAQARLAQLTKSE